MKQMERRKFVDKKEISVCESLSILETLSIRETVGKSFSIRETVGKSFSIRETVGKPLSLRQENKISPHLTTLGCQTKTEKQIFI